MHKKRLLMIIRLSYYLFLRKELNNYLIDIKTMIRKDIEGEKKLYTSIDVFKDMIKNNRSLKVLHEELGLDPDY